ncbi:MAG: transposase [Treponema sp.]|nr:transposase [Treponema sp.]
MDECPKQPIGEVQTLIPPQKGEPLRYNGEYVRNETREIFMRVAPLEGWRRAEQIKQPVDRDFPDARKIVLVMDNYTHIIGSPYEAFPAEEARRIRDNLEIHYTPKYGSRLNMAEIEINVLVNHGLSGRIPSLDQMKKEVKAWAENRNKHANKINRRFSTDDARIKLKRLYPLFE